MAVPIEILGAYLNCNEMFGVSMKDVFFASFEKLPLWACKDGYIGVIFG